MSYRRYHAFGFLVALLGVTAGCAHPELVDERLAWRRARLNSTLEWAGRQERNRAAKLDWLAEQVENDRRLQARRRDRNAELLRELIQRDREQVAEWSSPEGREAFEQVFGGDVDQIAPNAIRLFF